MDTSSTMVGHVFIFLTTVAGFVFQWMREGRRHDWEQEQFAQMGRDIRNGHAAPPVRQPER